MDTKVLSTGVLYSNLPESYIRPESERPRLSEVSDCEDVPVIDLGCEDRSQVIKQIGEACKTYSFLQVTNHGVSSEAVEKMQGVATEFFSLPVEEKLKLYSDDPSKTMRLSTSFNLNKEKVHNWRDYLRLHCHPLEKYVAEWPSNPSSFKSGPEDNSLEDESEVGDALVLLSVSNKSLKDDMETKSDTERDSENVKIAQSEAEEAILAALTLAKFTGVCYREKKIRKALGNTANTSKALRRLLAEGKVKRSGKGGRQQPYIYSLP